MVFPKSRTDSNSSASPNVKLASNCADQIPLPSASFLHLHTSTAREVTEKSLPCLCLGCAGWESLVPTTLVLC